ncbi:MAG: radical SAM protein [Candidatus Aegiribacteria sp.]|nr:radical SAM protein [Candidatus Aegiribacteria sp.]MBD3295719.1 radical SAM protein [Candidatus Fermentibacteria bacterium]
MRVLLLQSPTGRPEVPIYPVGLAFLAGQVRSHTLHGLDLSRYRDFSGELASTVGSYKPDVIAVSLRNIDDSSYPVTFSYVEPFSKVVRAPNEWNGALVVGGTGFSIYPDRILELFPRIDYGIPGEGETVFPELLDHLENGTGVQGWDGGRLLPWRTSDLSVIRPPDYTILDVSGYTAPDAIGIQSRRGCAYNCSYCTYGYLSGSSFRLRPLDHVLSDVESLEKMGVERFQFVDSVFNAPRGYFLDLVQRLAERDGGAVWSAWVDENVKPEVFTLMREAGAVKVDFSPDAISDRGLRLLSKRSTSDKLLPAVKAARKAGLQVGINFFNNNPGEGFWSLIRKLLFMLRVRIALGWGSTFVNIGTIRVYAHSPLAEKMKSEGMVEPDCDFFKPVFYRSAGPADLLYRLFQKLKRIKHG